MDALRRELPRRLAPHDRSTAIEILDPTDTTDRARLVALAAGATPVVVHDTIVDQLRELVAARRPARGRTMAEVDALVAEHLDGRSVIDHGRWIFYPWAARVVHVLPADEFHELRCDRNRYRITAAERDRLRAARIAVAGLSVGQATAVTLALEGIGATFHLADFDTLALSNLNRLRAGIHELGLEKAVIAARQLLEIDPYLDVRVFDHGVTDASIDAFLGVGPARVDLVVEECDDLYIKLRLRERARELGIPVIMETCDRGMLDVERFDREPDRPILHGLVDGVDADGVRSLSTRDKVPTVLRILDGAAISTDLAASLPEIDETISSWPQLASAVSLGAAIATDTARRILLGQLSTSGRFRVDLSHLIADGAVELSTPPTPVAAPAIVSSIEPCALNDGPWVTEGEVRFVVAHAVLAPSAGNTQPWRFRWSRDRLVCTVAPTHHWMLLDFEGAATHVAFGAAIENLVIAARSIGLAADVVLFPSADVVCEIRLVREGGRRDDGVDLIRRRVTNRRIGTPVPIEPRTLQALADATAAAGARLDLIEDRDALDRIGAIVGAGDRMQMLGPVMHRELVGELRLTRDQVAATRDGLDLATLELPPADAAGLHVIARPEVAARLRALGGGATFERRSRLAFASASAAGLFTIAGTDAQAYFARGRAVQRAWLAATGGGLAVQPHSGLPYLFARLERAGGEGLQPDERSTLIELRARWREIFPVDVHRAELMLVRLGVADPPSARSLRHELDRFLTIEP